MAYNLCKLWHKIIFFGGLQHWSDKTCVILVVAPNSWTCCERGQWLWDQSFYCWCPSVHGVVSPHDIWYTHWHNVCDTHHLADPIRNLLVLSNIWKYFLAPDKRLVLQTWRKRLLHMCNTLLEPELHTYWNMEMLFTYGVIIIYINWV